MAVLFYAGPETTGSAGDYPVYTTHILLWGVILAGIAAVLALIFPIIQMITQPKKAKGSLIGILALVVLVFVGYALASSEPLDFVKANPNNVPDTLKQVGTGLISMYILLGFGLLAIVVTEITKAVK